LTKINFISDAENVFHFLKTVTFGSKIQEQLEKLFTLLVEAVSGLLGTSKEVV
jgi:hypothetical protein